MKLSKKDEADRELVKSWELGSIIDVAQYRDFATSTITMGNRLLRSKGWWIQVGGAGQGDGIGVIVGKESESAEKNEQKRLRKERRER